MNKVILLGRLVRNPEVRKVNETTVCTFTIATNKRWKDKNGQKQEKVQFTNCKLWGKPGETVAEYSGKGKQLAVLGELETRDWLDKDGKKRYTTEVNVTDFDLVEFRDKEEVSKDEPF